MVDVAQGFDYVVVGGGTAGCALSARLSEPAKRPEPSFPYPVGHGFAISPVGLYSRSRGRVTLASPDPFDAPLIDPNALSAPEDLLPLIRGIRLARKIFASTAFATTVEATRTLSWFTNLYAEELAMTQTPSAMERIEIERACERIVYAYSRALDLGEMSAAADFFAENGSIARPMAPEQVIQGRETIRAALLTRPKTLRTKHLATNVMIDVVSRDEARGLSYLTMSSATPGDAAAPYISAGPVYFGEFKDRFVREGGEWKFLERRGSIQMKFFGAAP